MATTQSRSEFDPTTHVLNSPLKLKPYTIKGQNLKNKITLTKQLVQVMIFIYYLFILSEKEKEPISYHSSLHSGLLSSLNLNIPNAQSWLC